MPIYPPDERRPPPSDRHASTHSNDPRDQRQRYSREHSPDHYSRRKPDNSYHQQPSSRHSAPPPPRSQTQHSHPIGVRPRGYPSGQKRISWPPSPAVEDEKTSVLKEFPPRIPDVDKCEARIPGPVDQVPILLMAENMPDQIKRAYSANASEPRQPKPSSTKHNANSGRQPQPGSNLQHGRSAKPDGLQMPPRTPEATQRARSPYAYTPKAPDSDKTSSVDSGYFSSPELSKEAQSRRQRTQSNALRGNGKSRDGGSDSGRGDGGSEVSIGSRSDASSTQASARHSRVPSQTLDVKEPTPRLAEIKSEALHNNRRSMPPPAGPQESSRKVLSTPTGSPSASPSLSRNNSAEFSQFHSASRSPQLNSPGSQYPPSRVQFKDDDHSLQEPLRRSSTLPVQLEDKFQKASRLATTVSTAGRHHDRRPTGDRIPLSKGPIALPYPTDDNMTLMPSEQDHISKLCATMPGNDHLHRGHSDDDLPTMHSPKHDLQHRPKLLSRHTVGTNLPAIDVIAAAAAVGGQGAEPSPSVSRTPATKSNSFLSFCKHSKPSRSYDDFYYLEGCPEMMVCHDCMDAHLSHSSFRKQMKHFNRKDKDQRLKCEFSLPWMRTAWRLTQQQKRHDLKLLESVARINANDAHCPGGHAETGTWYSLLDKRDAYVDNFNVCPADVKRIEALLPFMRGRFAKRSTPRKRKCDFRLDSHRFEEYIKTLFEIEDSAATKKIKYADPQRFVELARQKAEVHECTKDDLVPDNSWHFAPSLPEFTVCEECYTSVIWPAISNGSSVANKFHQTPQQIDDDKTWNPRRESSWTPEGTSCQLYSPRMRRVFKTAVYKGDFEYLTYKAKERKDVELDLHAEVLRLKKSKEKPDKVQKEFEKVTQEWQEWE